MRRLGFERSTLRSYTDGEEVVSSCAARHQPHISSGAGVVPLGRDNVSIPPVAGELPQAPDVAANHPAASVLTSCGAAASVLTVCGAAAFASCRSSLESKIRRDSGDSAGLPHALSSAVEDFQVLALVRWFISFDGNVLVFTIMSRVANSK